jgi:hypothetical protein
MSGVCINGNWIPAAPVPTPIELVNEATVAAPVSIVVAFDDPSHGRQVSLDPNDARSF